jgi:osmotically-inducible protein OsmY
VTVEDGSVTLTGPTDPTSRRLAGLLAREVPGVLEVRFDQE